MSKDEETLQSIREKENQKIENKNRINQIVNTAEKYTRTERHLEQYSDIGSEENLNKAREIQNKRKQDIEELTNRIVYGQNINQDEYNNLVENYASTEGYIENNAENMSEEDYKAISEKQKNRQEKINELTRY